MFRHLFLASSLLIAVPAFAQETPKTESETEQQQPQVQNQAKPETQTATTDDAAPGNQNAQDKATAAQASKQPALPAQGAPAQTRSMAETTAPAQLAPAVSTPPAATQPAEAAAQPAATQDQVAGAVGKDFGIYDKDANGGLDKTEFAAWMSNLRKAAEPNFVPGSPEAQAWSEQAFTQADADKSASINQQELTTFLTPKPS